MANTSKRNKNKRLIQIFSLYTVLKIITFFCVCVGDAYRSKAASVWEALFKINFYLTVATVTVLSAIYEVSPNLCLLGTGEDSASLCCIFTNKMWVVAVCALLIGGFASSAHSLCCCQSLQQFCRDWPQCLLRFWVRTMQNSSMYVDMLFSATVIGVCLNAV